MVTQLEIQKKDSSFFFLKRLKKYTGKAKIGKIFALVANKIKNPFKILALVVKRIGA